MVQIARILCPIDFSEFSRHALHNALALAKRYAAEVTVLHIVPSLPGADLLPIELTPKEHERLLADMRRFAGPIPSEARVRFAVVVDAPAVHEEILAEATDLQTDLLVLGSHGRSGFRRLLLGSVAERIARDAPCPVLIVPAGAPDLGNPLPPHAGGARILCPVDYSPGSLKALEYAITFAKETHATLTVLHVIEVPPELREHVPPSGEINIDQIRAAAEAEHLRCLRGLIPQSVRTFCAVEAVVRDGGAHRQILQLATERSIDLIIMGLQGRGALDRLVFGSNTQRVMRAAACPVLIVRQDVEQG